MIIKGIKDEDFVNYKKPSMFIIFPFCDFKCEMECGETCCQNSSLAQSSTIEIPVEDIVKRYIDNPITKAIVCGGLEPFDSFGDLYNLIKELRKYTDDDIVIYTGYKKGELLYLAAYRQMFNSLLEFPNIIIKFGRFIPNQEPHYDDVLGIKLASNNQFAERIS